MSNKEINKNDIEKKVEKQAKEKIKRETQQLKELRKYLEKVKKTPSLGISEENKLWKKVIKGDKSAKDKIFKTHLNLVVKNVKEFVKKYPSLAELDKLELIWEGESGLRRAIDLFNLEKKFKFAEYASCWIHQAITRYIASPELKGIEREKAIAEIKIREEQQSKKLKQYLKKINKIPVLSYEEEKQLWKSVSERDESAKERIFEGHLKLVIETAKDLAKTTGKDYPYLTLLELIQEGEKGLQKAINVYSPKRRDGIGFLHYLFRQLHAKPWIESEMNKAIYRKAGVYPYVIEVNR